MSNIFKVKVDSWSWFLLCKYLTNGYGKKSLSELIRFLKENYNLKVLTTTYIYGNQIAKKLYESLGFVEIEIIEEDGIHEVDMRLEVE